MIQQPIEPSQPSAYDLHHAILERKLARAQANTDEVIKEIMGQ